MDRWQRLTILAAVLCGCASAPSVPRVHGACAEISQSIRAHATCLQYMAESDEVGPSLRQNQPFQLYQAYAATLEEQVSAGRMGEAEARFRLASFVEQLEQQRRARADASYDALQRHTQQMEQARRPAVAPAMDVDCSTFGGVTRCRSR